MTYLLGIDLGTTFTAAAVCRRDRGAWGPAEVVPLGNRTATVGSVVFVDHNGSLLFGEPAERRVVTDPTRVAREYKRRIGDDTPMLVGDTPFHAAELAARFARWVVDTVSAREGSAPQTVAITHPAGWGRHRIRLLTDALGEAGLDGVVLLSEPHAAAICYASTGRVADGSTIAVYDLGGGTFDATVLRKSGPDAFEQLGTPVGHDRLGGLDFDELIFENLREHHPEAFRDFDPGDPAQLGALALLRRECTEAKENLSEDTEAVIPIMLTGTPVRARLVRAEFEHMIRSAIEETVGLLGEAVLSASTSVPELSAVLLVGGSARIPLITELLSAALERPIVVDIDPKAAVALGAVLALRAQQPGDTLPALPAPAAVPVPATMPERPVVSEPLVLTAQARSPRLSTRGRRLLVIGTLTLAALIVGTLAGVPGDLAGVISPAHADTSNIQSGGDGSGAGGGPGSAAGKNGKTGRNGKSGTGDKNQPGSNQPAANSLPPGAPGSTPNSPASAGANPPVTGAPGTQGAPTSDPNPGTGTDPGTGGTGGGDPSSSPPDSPDPGSPPASPTDDSPPPTDGSSDSTPVDSTPTSQPTDTPPEGI